MKAPLIALAAAGFVLASPPASAGAREMRVEYSDLDLSRSKGQATLDKRVRSAARVVCGYGSADARSMSARTSKQQCYHAAIERARNNIAAVTEQRASGG